MSFNYTDSLVTFLELLGIGLGAASLSGFIVGAFSIYNGRATRRLIMGEEKRTQEILNRMEKTLGGMEKTLIKNTELLNKNTKILAKVAKGMAK